MDEHHTADGDVRGEHGTTMPAPVAGAHGRAMPGNALPSGVFQKGRHEEDVPAKYPEARQEARLSSPDVDTCRAGHLEGPSPPRAGAPLGLTGRPATVQGRAAFAALARSARRARSGPVTVHFQPAPEPVADVRVAYTVGRKVGGAVVRNLWRRRLRAVAFDVISSLPPGDYLVGVGPGVRAMDYAELRERVAETMRRASERRA